jgi:uncharacterized OsmC-like protein
MTTSTAAPSRAETLTAIVAATAGAVSTDPDAARVLFTASGRSTDAVATELRSRRHTWRIDEPASLGGADSATNPVEAALGALLACQTVTYRFWAAQLGIRLDDVELTADGDLDVRGFFGLDDDVRPGFSQIRVAVRLVGPEPERYAELHAAVDAHCPVLDLFTRPTSVTTTLVTD